MYIVSHRLADFLRHVVREVYYVVFVFQLSARCRIVVVNVHLLTSWHSDGLFLYVLDRWKDECGQSGVGGDGVVNSKKMDVLESLIEQQEIERIKCWMKI